MMDYSGPLYVRKLFTCASTRGIHLELAENCSAEQFVLAFRRVVGRRELPRLLMSDNAKNFKKSAKEITETGRSTLIQEHITNAGLEWMFIVEKAPWWSGSWERLIQVTKDSIKKVASRSLKN